MAYRKTVLIVEEDRAAAALLRALLAGQGYKLVEAPSGERALRLFASHHPDLVLLDPGLPDIPGLELLKALLQLGWAPVIVVSARGEEGDKVAALDSGAVDYITKPFGNGELLARVRAMLRLRERLGSPQARRKPGRFDGFAVDYDAYEVTVRGRPVHLTPIEYKIVELLARSAGRALTHEEIITHIWGRDNCDIQVLRVNIANIRRKIEKNPAAPRCILTEPGVGYRVPCKTP